MIVTLCGASYLLIGYILGLFFTWYEIKRMRARPNFDENRLLLYKRYNEGYGLIIAMTLGWPIIGLACLLMMVTDWFINRF